MDQIIGPSSLLGTQNPAHPVSRYIFRGYITDYIQYLNQYEVQTSGSIAKIGTNLGAGSNTLSGVKSHNLFSVGSEVLCYQDPSMLNCVILGSIPALVGYNGFNVSDWVHQYSGVGLLDDSCHKELLDLPNERFNFNNSSPHDTFQGEYGFTTPLGLLFNISNNSIALRSGDLTGLWMFHDDQYLRLAGYNYDFWSASNEVSMGDDEGELYSIERWSPFAWEMKGISRPGIAFTQTTDTTAYDPATGLDPIWKPDQNQNYYEPIESDQIMIPRFSIINSYLGDLRKEIVSCPPPNLTNNVDTLSNSSQHYGLSEFTRHINGLVEIRSTKGIILEKTVFIPTLKETKLRADPAGDTKENYKFSGSFGQGDEHSKKPMDLANNNSRVAQMFDLLAYTHNKIGLQSAYRRKDWTVSKETTLPNHDVSIDKELYRLGSSNFRAAVPKTHTLLIDHRKDATSEYSRARSMIALNDDGSVLIEDGWGSQLVLEKGNITLSCKGDVIIANGRSFNVLAPKDINLRAGECLDLSAGTGDMRLKSDKNLHVLGGNSGAGGVLIESRGEGSTLDFTNKYGTDVISSGITIKAKDSNTAIIGSQIYIRSIQDDIILDANEGRTQIQSYSNRELHLTNSITTLFGARPTEGSIPKSTEYRDSSSVIFGQSGNFSTLATTFISTGSGLFDGQLTARSVASSDGGIGAWGKGTQASIDRAKFTLDSSVSRAAEVIDQPRTTGRPYNSTTSIGSINQINSIGFSFRTDTQYGVDFTDEDNKLFLIEARWAQIARIESLGSTVWNEPYVISPDRAINTAPYPGYDNWNSIGTLGRIDLEYWTTTSGESYGLDAYDSNDQTMEYVVPATNYLINK